MRRLSAFEEWAITVGVVALIMIIAFFVTESWANTPGQPQVTLTWSDTDANAKFNVYRSVAPALPCAGTPTPLAQNVPLLTYTDGTVAAGTSYNYAVSAVDPALGGESACSAGVQVVPGLAPTPTGLQAH